MLNNTENNLKTPILIEFGKLKEVMDWCRTNCSSNWHLNEVNPGIYAYEMSNFVLNANNYVFEFEDERDYILFKLKFQ